MFDYDAETIAMFRANLETYYHAADSDTLADGQEWYGVAYEICEMLADWYHVSIEQVAALIAVTSNSRKWETNVDLTIMALHDRGINYMAVPLSSQARRKASETDNGRTWRKRLHTAMVDAKIAQILDNPCETREFYADCVSSTKSKTWNFYNNILSAGSGESVTVDAHIAGAAVGHRLLSYPARTAIAQKYSAFIQTAIKEIARSYNRNFAAVQAVIWLQYKMSTG